MLQTSTPVCVRTPERNKLRKSVLLRDVTNVGSPMRRLSNLAHSVSHIAVDDDLERSSRRNEADIQKRVSNIGVQQSPMPTNENEIRDHFQICLKMYAENKISSKNAWSLKIIDYMRAVFSSKEQAKASLQVAGTSLDVGTKIYGIRVDDIHSDGLKLASNMARVNPEHDDDNEDRSSGDENKEGERPKKKKRPKRLLTDPKITVAKDPTSLLSDVSKLESVFFQTRLDLEASSTDNLFTNKLPMHLSGHKFMLLSDERSWPSCDGSADFTIDKFPMELAIPSKLEICAQFTNFEIDEWDPENENELLNYERTVTEDVVYDAEGIPIPELDGSVHDLFANAEPENNYASTDEEEINGIGQIALQNKTVAQIVNFQPGDNDNELYADDYSYSATIKLMGNKRITQVWAGPSHWKLKHIRPNMSRFSGQQEKQVAKSVKKVKIQPSFIDFLNGVSSLDKTKLYKCKRRATDESAYKCTLPQIFTNFNYKNSSFMLKPLQITNNISTQKVQQETIIDNEVQPYHYDNPNDSQYCSQNGAGGDDDADYDVMHEEELPPAAHQNCHGENLIDAPELIPKIYVPYALQAKKMDMRKLKTAVWKNLVSKTSNENIPDDDMYKREVLHSTFSNLYTHLPDRINEKMRQELSCPLAFVALLHLANEQNLQFQGQLDLTDFLIRQCKVFEKL
uniref:Condensin complex subunit 2 n=1 Tax=Photinus pyralis TaxID=7054 RepID=A0A1Y1LM91_PHOPY